MHPDTRSLLVCSRVLLLVSLVGCALSARAGTGAVVGDTLIIYADTDTESATGTTANEHKVTPFAAISPTTDQDGISSVLIGRLFRASAAAEDTYTGKAGLLYIDAHYQLSSIGSNDEYTK
mgnify:CR=1 FL=1